VKEKPNEKGGLENYFYLNLIYYFVMVNLQMHEV
jgi:hypothetical protein